VYEKKLSRGEKSIEFRTAEYSGQLVRQKARGGCEAQVKKRGRRRRFRERW